MKLSARRSAWCITLSVTMASLLGTGVAAQSPPPAKTRLEIIKESQNPLTRELGSVSFENIVAFDLGLAEQTAYTLLIKPRIPIILNEHLSLINRSSLPILSTPPLFGRGSRNSGLGDIQHTTLLSPTTGRRIIWGLGATAGFPSASDDRLGSGKWTLGPAAIFVYTPRRMVLGLVAQNQWSVGGDSQRRDINALHLRPLVNINLPRQWFIVSRPNFIADWKADADARWLIEAGGGIGKIFRVGRLAVSLESQFFGYPVGPKQGPRWAARFDIKLLFRRGALAERIREPGRGEPGRGEPGRGEPDGVAPPDASTRGDATSQASE